MAISLRNAGSWAYAASGSVTPTLPTHASGDMLIVRVAYKSSAIATCAASTATSGWAKIGEYHSGTTNSGNGTGSVAVAAFWKIAASAAETNPTIDFSQTVTQVGHVALSYQKGASEIWDTPVGDGGGEEVQDAGKSITVASHISVTAGDMVDVFFGIRDDCTVTSPTFTQTGVTFGTVSEQPGTAGSDTSGADGAYDGCYRLASSGTSSAAAVLTCTLDTSEWAAAWQTRLRLTLTQTLAPDPVAAVTAVPVSTADAGAVTLAPDPVGAVSAVAASTADAVYALAPDPVTAPTAVPASTADPGALSLAPDPIAAVSAVPVSTADPGAVALAPDPLAAVTAVTSSTADAAYVLAPDPLAAVSAVTDSTVTAEAGAQTITPDPVAALLTVTASTADPGILALAPDPVAAISAVTSSTVDATYTLTPDPVTATAAVTTSTADPGAVTLSPDPAAAVSAVPESIADASQYLQPDPVAAVLAVPTGYLDRDVQPAAVATVTAVTDSTVTAVSTTTLTPDPVATATAVTSSTADALYTLAPDPVATVTSVTTVTINTSLDLSPDPVAASTVVTASTAAAAFDQDVEPLPIAVLLRVTVPQRIGAVGVSSIVPVPYLRGSIAAGGQVGGGVSRSGGIRGTIVDSG